MSSDIREPMDSTNVGSNSVVGIIGGGGGGTILSSSGGGGGGGNSVIGLNVSSNDACQSIVHSLMCHRQGTRNEAFVQRAIESLVRKLRDRRDELDALITAITTSGAYPTRCVTVPRTLDGRQQVAGRKGLPHVTYARIWRWPDLHSSELHQAFSACQFSFNKQTDLVCVNPYHYDRIVSTAHSHPNLLRSISTGAGGVGAGNNNATTNINVASSSSIGFNHLGDDEEEVSDIDDDDSLPLSTTTIPPPLPSSSHTQTTLSSSSSHHTHPTQVNSALGPGGGGIGGHHIATVSSNNMNLGQPSITSTTTNHGPQPPSHPLSGFGSLAPHQIMQQQQQQRTQPFYPGYAPPQPPPGHHGMVVGGWPPPPSQPPPRGMQPPPHPLQQHHRMPPGFYGAMPTHYATHLHHQHHPQDTNPLQPPPPHPSSSSSSWFTSPTLLNLPPAPPPRSGGGGGNNYSYMGDVMASGPPLPPPPPPQQQQQPLISPHAMDPVLPAFANQRLPDYWCTISYFELDQQVGESFKVRSRHNKVIVDGYTDPSSPNRFCLGQLSNVHRSDQSEKSRLYIGQGVELVHLDNGDVWIRCLSKCSIFVQSYYLDREAGRNPGEAVHKIYPGASIKVFDIQHCYAQMQSLSRVSHEYMVRQVAAVAGAATPLGAIGIGAVGGGGVGGTGAGGGNGNGGATGGGGGSGMDVGVDDLRRLCILRLSFVKGWGPDYPRHNIKETPCWIEIHLHRPLQHLDEMLQSMNVSNLRPTRHFFANQPSARA